MRRTGKKRSTRKKCDACHGPLETPDGFAARVGKTKLCIGCALKLVEKAFSK